MTTSKYPRKGMTRNAKPGSQCQVCRAAPAKVITDIEQNEFRGDDEVLRACEACRRLTAAQMMAKAAASKAALDHPLPPAPDELPEDRPRFFQAPDDFRRALAESNKCKHEPATFLNVSKDFRTLQIPDWGVVPETYYCCPQCAVAYMRSFNEAHLARKAAAQ